MDERKIGDIMRELFRTEDGMAVLAWILSRCGMSASNPVLISADLIALGNSILKEMEVGEYGNMGLYMRGLLDSYDRNRENS